MPGRILISASSNLDLTYAQISGANYLSVTATNQIVGSASAAISAPYSSFNVAAPTANHGCHQSVGGRPCRRGAATRRLGAPGSSIWSPSPISITTHSGQTLPSTTNSYTVTNDYRVAIVANQATPTTPAQVWDLSLHGSNNIVISDVYNILDNLSLDCVGLTLTTNGPGAQSPMGVLNLQGTMESWTAATPNLRNLTNYGEIYLPITGVNSLGIFGTGGKTLWGAPQLRDH